jgi:hypothetical protein
MYLAHTLFHARYAIDGLQGVAEVFAVDQSAVSAQMLLDPWLFTGIKCAKNSSLDPSLETSKASP